MVSLDWSVSLGNILTVLGFVAGGLMFVLAVRRDVDILSTRLKPLEDAVVQLTTILVTLARQDVRLEAVERDVERNDARKQRRQAESR